MLALLGTTLPVTAVPLNWAVMVMRPAPPGARLARLTLSVRVPAVQVPAGTELVKSTRLSSTSVKLVRMEKIQKV
jgi:hypothetical protein